MFVNRKRELEFLERKWRESGAQLIIIYGRRRVGKTTLLKEFLKGKFWLRRIQWVRTLKSWLKSLQS